jgi:hypothetical protein
MYYYMNAYMNYFAYSYVKNNLDSINNCIESYLEDGNTEKCDNEVVGSWLGENGPALFKQVKCSEKEDSEKEDSKKEDSKKEDSKKEDSKKEDSKKEDSKKEDSKKEDSKKELIADFEEKGNGVPHAFGKEVASGRHNLAGMEISDCKFYADSIGYSWGGNSNDGNVFGCFLQHEPKTVYYNEKDSMTQCDGVDGSICIQRDNQHVNKENCAFYAGNIGYRWGGNSNDGNVKGCFVQHEPKTVYFNEKNTDTKCDGVAGSICIQKKMPDLGQVGAKSKGDSFINIPKKSNGMIYVILFVLAVFLFRKLKK